MKNPIHPKWELSKLLSDPVVVGDIIRTAILMEFDLDIVLTDYFVGLERRDSFSNLLLAERTFHQKIELLRSLPINKSLKSYQASMVSLTRIRKLRNFVAHGFGLREDQLDRMVADRDLMKILLGYPKTLLRELQLARLRLSALSKSKSFAQSSLAQVYGNARNV